MLDLHRSGCAGRVESAGVLGHRSVLVIDGGCAALRPLEASLPIACRAVWTVSRARCAGAAVSRRRRGAALRGGELVVGQRAARVQVGDALKLVGEPVGCRSRRATARARRSPRAGARRRRRSRGRRSSPPTSSDEPLRPPGQLDARDRVVECTNVGRSRPTSRDFTNTTARRHVEPPDRGRPIALERRGRVDHDRLPVVQPLRRVHERIVTRGASPAVWLRRLRARVRVRRLQQAGEGGRSVAPDPASPCA